MDNISKKKILLIDDEKAIAETVVAYANRENFQIVYAETGEAGMKEIEKNNFDVIILDWMLPGISGLELIKLVRKKSDIPILMLTARNEETDIVLGFEMGADDYMTKPFGPRELIARINALLRRTKNSETNRDLNFDNLVISFQKKEVLKKGESVKLTPAEFRILEALSTCNGDVVSREDLMTKALGYHDFLNDRTLDTHIKNLRKKIEDDPKNPKIIQTVREAGFKFSH